MTRPDNGDRVPVIWNQLTENVQQRGGVVDLFQQLRIFFVPDSNDPSTSFVQAFELFVRELLAIFMVRDIRCKFLVDAGDFDEFAWARSKNVSRI